MRKTRRTYLLMLLLFSFLLFSAFDLTGLDWCNRHGFGGGGGGPAPTTTATPDPLYPWDTYPSQGWTPQYGAVYFFQSGQVWYGWYHGWIHADGDLMDVSAYAYDIGTLVQYFVIQHGTTAPLAFLPSAVENIYQGFYSTPMIKIDTNLAGCENPYPTPVSCIVGPLPNDPYNSYPGDFWRINYATFVPKVPVYHTNAAYEMHANPDLGKSPDIVSWLGTDNTWLHRAVYP